MKARVTKERQPRPHSCRRIPAANVVLLFVALSFVSGNAFPSASSAQSRRAPEPDAKETQAVLPGQTSATIGESGFKVTIPEIQMKRIIGEQPTKPAKPSRHQEQPPSYKKSPVEPKAQPKPQTEPSGYREQAPSSEITPAQPEARPESQTEPQIQRLPFSGVPGTEPPGVERVTPEAASEEAKPLPESVPEETPVKPSPDMREPLIPDEPQASSAKETAPAGLIPAQEHQPFAVSPPKEGGPVKEPPSAIVSPPQAPEDAVAPSPPPRKEILKSGSIPSPPRLMGNAPAKEKSSTLSVSPAETDDLADPREWIQLEPRREPDVIPPAGPEPLPEPEQPPLPEPEALPPVLEPSPPPPAELSPAPEPMPVPGAEPGPKESVAPEPGSVPAEEAPTGKERIPTIKEPSSPPKETLSSPLDDDAVHSSEVRDYLRQAAPILEELSLLMTRAPSLTIADYDPSDPGAPPIPKEIQLKMETLKWELRVLDTKTFDIIPPKRYVEFHSLIRDAIAETYQACEGIMTYLQESKQENLQSVLDHLSRAKKLIQRTRERTGSG